jgi:cell wall-associated NlpC family hydrolase
MSLRQRRALSAHSDTEALMGERVVVRRVSGAWAKVVVPDQPSQKDARGYPGWIPLRQLTGVAPTSTALVATVVKRTAWLRRDDSGVARVTEISSGTTLPSLGRVGSYARVRTPRGAVRRIAAGAVVVHSRGTATLKPHTRVLATAKHYLGLAYLWGGLSGFGLDCSGLTWLSNRLHGTRIPRDALPQSRHGTPVSRSRLRRGDLIFYATSGLVHHVTMYAGSGRMIEAPHTGAVTRIVRVRSTEYHGARRY